MSASNLATVETQLATEEMLILRDKRALEAAEKMLELASKETLRQYAMFLLTAPGMIYQTDGFGLVVCRTPDAKKLGVYDKTWRLRPGITPPRIDGILPSCSPNNFGSSWTEVDVSQLHKMISVIGARYQKDVFLTIDDKGRSTLGYHENWRPDHGQQFNPWLIRKYFAPFANRLIGDWKAKRDQEKLYITNDVVEILLCSLNLPKESKK